jgi:hypothetical protein
MNNRSRAGMVLEWVIAVGVGCEHSHGVPAIRINCPPEMTMITLVPLPPRAAGIGGGGDARTHPRNLLHPRREVAGAAGGMRREVAGAAGAAGGMRHEVAGGEI